MQHDVRLAIHGDRDAYGRLVRHWYATVSAVALGITRDAQLSEDVAQEAFLTAWLRLNRLRNPDSFAPWLRQITRNIAHTAARSRHRRLRREVTGEVAERALAAHLDESEDADELVLRDERARIIDQALNALPDDTRDCVVLYYREGESADRVALLLGLAPATVRKRLERARRRLREPLRQKLGELLAQPESDARSAHIVALLGTMPQHALPAGSAALGAAAGAAGGALLGLWLSVRRIREISRLLNTTDARRRFATLATTVAAILGVALPLLAPGQLWLWFTGTQVLIAYLNLVWLPVHGVALTRRAVLRWLLALACGTAAVAWASLHM